MSDTTETRWERHNEAGRRYFAQGELGQAEEAFKAAIREAMLLGAENLRLAASLSNLGQLKYRQKDYPQAEALFRRSLAIREHVLGTEHQGIVQSINNLAALYYARGDLDQAEPLFRRALAINEAQLGDDHADVAAALNNLARLCFRRSDSSSAAPLLTRLLAIKERTLGDQHPEIAGILLSLVKVRAAEHEYGEAESLSRRALAIRESVSQSDADPAVAGALEALAEALGAQGKLEEQRHAIQRARAIRGATSPGEPLTAPRAEPISGPRGLGSNDQHLRPSTEIPVAVSPVSPAVSTPAITRAPAPKPDFQILHSETIRVEPIAPVEVMSMAAQLEEASSGPKAAPAVARKEPTSGPKFAPPVAPLTVEPIGAVHAERERTPSAVAQAARRRTPAQQPRFPRRIPTPARLAMAAATAPADAADTGASAFATPDAAVSDSAELREITFARRQPRRWGVIGGIAAAIGLAAVTAWAMVGRDHAEGGAAAPAVEQERATIIPTAAQKTAPRPSVPVSPAMRDSARDSTPVMSSTPQPSGSRESEDAGTARRPALSSSSGRQSSQEGEVRIPSGLSRIGIDKVLRDVEENTKARVDSASRTIPVKPPTFGRP